MDGATSLLHHLQLYRCTPSTCSPIAEVSRQLDCHLNLSYSIGFMTWLAKIQSSVRFSIGECNFPMKPSQGGSRVGAKSLLAQRLGFDQEPIMHAIPPTKGIRG